MQLGVVGAGTASIFHDIAQSLNRYLEIGFTPSKGMQYAESMLGIIPTYCFWTSINYVMSVKTSISVAI